MTIRPITKRKASPLGTYDRYKVTVDETSEHISLVIKDTYTGVILSALTTDPTTPGFEMVVRSGIPDNHPLHRLNDRHIDEAYMGAVA